MIMKTYFVLSLVLILGSAAIAQRPDEIVATSKDHVFRINDLSDDVQKSVEGFPARLKEFRTGLLDMMVNQRLLEAEANALGVSKGKLLKTERDKAPAPTDAEITAFYNANKNAFAGRPLAQVKEPISNYMRGQGQQKKLDELFARLRTKYKYSAGKDINTVGIGGGDVVANVNGKAITAKEFDDFTRLDFFELRMDLADLILNDLNEKITAVVVAEEARSLGIEPDALLAREITDKMKEFSDEERESLTDALRSRLYPKYQVKILYKAPEPPVQNISVDDDPATGPANAPVTIVMFSDFQCSACSATHPLLKNAMAGYPGKIRFVVRDFPIEVLHENAWRAALAAGAANAQGKFFEYTEILYTHQDALDDASLKKYAADLGLNAKQFDIDFNSEKTAAEVRKDMADGESYGINGTPTIFVNGVRVRDLTISAFRNAIEKALQK